MEKIGGGKERERGPMDRRERGKAGEIAGLECKENMENKMFCMGDLALEPGYSPPPPPRDGICVRSQATSHNITSYILHTRGQGIGVRNMVMICYVLQSVIFLVV
jgi:hypothetical protein